MNKKLLFLLLPSITGVKYQEFRRVDNIPRDDNTTTVVFLSTFLLIIGVLIFTRQKNDKNGPKNYKEMDDEDHYPHPRKRKKNYEDDQENFEIIKEKQIEISKNYLYTLEKLINKSNLNYKRERKNEIQDFLTRINNIDIENLNMIEVGNAICHITDDIDKWDKQEQSYLTKQQLKIYTDSKYLYPFPKSVKELENKLNGSSIKEILPLQKNAIKELNAIIRQQQALLDQLA